MSLLSSWRDGDDTRTILVTVLLGAPRTLRHVYLPRSFSAEHIMSMPASTAPRRNWTPEEFYSVRDIAPAALRHELVDGELLVTPAPGRTHQSIIARLIMGLGSYVLQQRLGELLPAPFDVRLSKSIVLQPDLLVIPSGAPYSARMTEIAHVSLAIEILSSGSARMDRVTKRRKYQEHGVPEYWVVDPASRTVERWRPGDERAELIAASLVWEPSGASLPFALELATLFADLPGIEHE